jgi:gliding motility-associated-like protein
MSFELTINTVPLLVTLPDVEQCNDTVFDLVSLQPSLSINAATETFEFYNSAGTLIDPSNGLDPTNYQLPDPNTNNEETITVTVKNSSTLGSGCSQQTSFVIRLGACDIPSSFPVLDEVLCETSTDPLGGGQDGFETFDKSIFDNIEADLITAEPLFGIFGTEINFFRSDADATAGVSTTAIDKTADYTTSAGQGFTFNATENRWEQELWVRVENTTLGTACFDTQQVATLYINKLPELLTPTVDVNQCDVGIFNLTDQEDNLSSNYANEEFEYYDSTGILIDPINGLDPTNYAANGQNEIITVTIKTKPSLGTACINTTATINLAWSVTTLPAGYTLKDEYLVETDPDPKGQGQDGVETFDKSIFTTVQSDLITAEPAFSGKTFSFYRSQNDALTSSNKIDTTVDFATDEQTNDGFTFNTAENRWEQQIWIYIEDNVTTAIATCYGLYHIATVYVEKRPVFYDVTMQELCDEQTPLDMKSLFDTTSLFSEFTTDPTGTVTQDTSLFTVEYTYVDDTGAPKTLEPTLPSNFNTTDQTITVTLTNNSTNSALAAGVSSGTIEFKVYQQPVAYPSDPSVPGVYTFVECDDDNDGLAVGEEVFDMSSITTRLLTDISGTYAAQDPNDFDFEYSVAGTIITLGSDYTATTGDQIEVKITNPLYPVCEETITIDFIVNPLPSFDIDDTTVICLNLTQPVEIGTSNWNGAADPSIYTYSWTLDSDPSFSETTETIFPVKGGIYTVVVEDPITFCTQTKSITVTESDIASIDLDDDGDVTDTEYDHFIEVLDLTDDNTNTIKINNIADLGIGDYEFSLDNFNYQDDNEFTDLDPGVYTLYIRDKNSYYSYTYGCGILEVTVSVIGYKKYFTPNNDGINDKWKILGIRIDFNNASEIYIFNRYGKLLKQLDPITDGWDGTYLGKPMPATDYWFRVYLEDGREFKGHFSLIRGKN